jgi:hypothetical protein
VQITAAAVRRIEQIDQAGGNLPRRFVAQQYVPVHVPADDQNRPPRTLDRSRQGREVGGGVNQHRNAIGLGAPTAVVPLPYDRLVRQRRSSSVRELEKRSRT